MSYAMSLYSHSKLSGLHSIRLLRLMPHEAKAAPIQCQLFNYSLRGKYEQPDLDDHTGTHLYEALSYVWGDSDKLQSISIDNHDFPVTVNLYAALSHLRDCTIERIIWVDAVCINQADWEERGRQVQLMAEIYSKANRVVVWLGIAADDSDGALEEIRVAAGNESTNPSGEKKNQQAILALLQRPWFRRIWVLQEVAAARHILIMCGSKDIDGYAFCLGLRPLRLSYATCPGLQSLIRSVTYLIRGSIFRPKHARSSSDKVSLDIRPLCELIDMYHTHEATERCDKVYALLGMSSDNPSAAGLSPDYRIPWGRLFKHLIEYLLYGQVSAETWDDREMAVIKSKGCILGKVSLVKSHISWDDKQVVDITFKNTPRYLGDKMEWSACWTLQVSAKPIRQGDLVCLLRGASQPTIIRPSKDYLAIIMIAITPLEDTGTQRKGARGRALFPLVTNFPHDFLLVWKWEKSLGKFQDQEEYETLLKTVSQGPESLNPRLADQATRLWNMALILEDAEEYENAEKRLQEAIRGYERMFGKEHPHTVKSMNKLGLVYKGKQQWKEAEKLFKQVTETR
ncbi:HET-domain-containing protein, partial [Zopfia rhizophila CBS 207.26]